jgi:hypothetical protein
MKCPTARLLLVSLATAVIGMAADNSIGTWKLNPGKSHIAETTPMKTSIVIIEQTADGVKFSDRRERKDGSIRDSEYTFKYDGKDYPAKGTSYDLVAVKQIDANTFTIEKKQKSGKHHTTGRLVVSPDGKFMTITDKGTNSLGAPTDQTFVYERQ